MIQASPRRVDFSNSTTSGFARRELSKEFFMKTICLVVVWTVLACISTIAAFAQRVEILSAYYGVGNYRIDVTERVQRLASNGESFEVSSRKLGLPSVPIPGKQLTVVYSVGRRQLRESAQEGETFRFKTADSFNRGESRSPRIVRGMYGGSGSYIDVTDALRDYAKRGESFRVSPEAFGLDPERTQGSRLRMTVIDRSGEREQHEYEDGDYVDFR